MSDRNKKKKKAAPGAALAKGVLRTSAKSFSLHAMDESWVDEVHALHAEVYDGLKPHQRTYLAPKTKEDIAAHFKNGGIVLGILCDEELIAKSMIHLTVGADGKTTTKIHGNTVAKSHQGNGLVQHLNKAWMALALAAGHETAAADVDVDNMASLKSLFNAGLVVVGKEIDPDDGGHLFKMKANVKEAALRCIFNQAGNDNEPVHEEKLADLGKIEQRLKDGYKGISVHGGKMIFKAKK